MYTKWRRKKGTRGKTKAFSLERAVIQGSLELPAALPALCHGHTHGRDYSCHCLAQPPDQGQIGAVISSVSLNSISWFRWGENNMNMTFPSSFWQGNYIELIFLKTCLNCFWFSAVHLPVLLGLGFFFWEKLSLNSWLNNFRLLWTAGFVKQQL